MKKFNKQKVFWSVVTACAVLMTAIPGNVSTQSVTTEKVEETAKETMLTVAGNESEVSDTMLEVATIEDRVIPTVAIAEELPVQEEVTEEAAQLQSTQVSPWANRVMAKVEESANVRAEANADSALVGRIRKGDAADIVERGAEWTKISSGNVTGYVKNEFLAFDAEAESLAAQLVKRTATIQTETLRVRKEANETAEVLDLVSGGKQYTVVSVTDGWVEIKLSSGTTGFVSAQYATVEESYGKAITIEEEQAAIAAEKAKKEAEARKKAEAEAKSKTIETTQREATAVSVDDLTLLGALVQLEAGGECYEGKLAVANVVLNRVKSPKYANTISGVIYQRGQFPGATNGKLDRILAKGVNSSCIQAAQDALNGNNNIGDCLYFNMKRAVNTSRLSDYTIIGNECFW